MHVRPGTGVCVLPSRREHCGVSAEGMLALGLNEPGFRPGSDSATWGWGGVTSWLMILYM